MIFFLALVPATMLTVAGYAVLYLAHRSEGAHKSFGRYLAFWAFTLAALVVLGSFLAAANGKRMHGMMMHGYAHGESLLMCPGMQPLQQLPPGAGTCATSGGALRVMPGAPPLPGSPGPPGPSPPK